MFWWNYIEEEFHDHNDNDDTKVLNKDAEVSIESKKL